MRLSATFDPRANGLNLIRLLLASGVIIAHAHPLTGNYLPYGPLVQILNDGLVDGFFAISGFLIVSSWMRTPKLVNFLRARTLRIFPAFYVCLIVTAFIFAPLGVIISGLAFPSGFLHDAAMYLVHNAGLYIFQYDIAGTPTPVNSPGWNGSLWTLGWEFLCYLAVLALGLVGLLKWRATIPVLFGAAVLGVIATSYGPLDDGYLAIAARFGVMFAAGAMVFQFQNKLPVNRVLIATAAALVIAASWLPDYRLIAPLPIAYLLLSIGALIKSPRFQFRNDISYGIYIYAFPVQQLLIIAGTTALGVAVNAALTFAITIPLALASWFLIEKPILRLKRSKRPARLPQPATV